MKHSLIALFILGLFAFAACDKDENDPEYVLDYYVFIASPTADDKHVGDSLHIRVEFFEYNDSTLHHINVRIFNDADSTEIYNQPTTAHLHEESGTYDFHDHIVLDVEPNTNWTLEATIWGEDENNAEEKVSETVQFHVHP